MKSNIAAAKKQNMDKLDDFVPRARFVDVKG